MRGMRLGPRGQVLLMGLLLVLAVVRVFGSMRSGEVPAVSGLHAAAPLPPARQGG